MRIGTRSLVALMSFMFVACSPPTPEAGADLSTDPTTAAASATEAGDGQDGADSGASAATPGYDDATAAERVVADDEVMVDVDFEEAVAAHLIESGASSETASCFAKAFADHSVDSFEELASLPPDPGRDEAIARCSEPLLDQGS